MVITNLKLLNFRNYITLDLNLSPDLNILTGMNGQGKTNILEAIYILAITKSPFTMNDIHLINNGSTKALITGTINKNEYFKKYNIELSSFGKVIKIGQKKISKLSEYISQINVILFSPNDLELIKGSPQLRRKFLNIEIGQINNKYLDIVNKYNKVIKIRNDYLRKIQCHASDSYQYLNIITDKLIEYSELIYIERQKFINLLNNNIGYIYEIITGLKNLQLNYLTSVDISDPTKIKAILREKYNLMRNQEIRNGMTLIGPNRDDFEFILDDVNLNNYGSQGQQRCAILALKLAEIEIFKLYSGEYPILLLDDIFSELDKKKCNNLIKSINPTVQTIITTTDLHYVTPKIRKEATILKVNNGLIEKG